MATLLRRPWLALAPARPFVERIGRFAVLAPQPASLAPEGSTGPVGRPGASPASRLILMVAIHIRGTNGRSQQRGPDDREFPKAE